MGGYYWCGHTLDLQSFSSIDMVTEPGSRRFLVDHGTETRLEKPMLGSQSVLEIITPRQHET